MPDLEGIHGFSHIMDTKNIGAMISGDQCRRKTAGQSVMHWLTGKRPYHRLTGHTY